MNKKRITVAMLLLTALLVSGCAIDEPAQKSGQNTIQPSPPDAVYQKIAATDAQRIMEESDDYILLDVRTQEEFEQTHIKGAMLLPDSEIQDKAEEKLKDKDAVILVYCRSGRRSAQAAQQLVNMGYTKVYDFGGINDWPFDTVSGTEGE